MVEKITVTGEMPDITQMGKGFSPSAAGCLLLRVDAVLQILRTWRSKIGKRIFQITKQKQFIRQTDIGIPVRFAIVFTSARLTIKTPITCHRRDNTYGHDLF